MASITLNSSSLKRYLDLFRNFDLSSRKKLIEELNRDIAMPEKNKTNKITTFFGAWEDERDSDEIIRDIRSARTSNPDIEAL